MTEAAGLIHCRDVTVRDLLRIDEASFGVVLPARLPYLRLRCREEARAA